MQSFQARIWYVIERAADVPGEWVGHCLDFDVVTQGRSLQHAFEMLMEAVGMVVVDDLEASRQPRDRRAPQVYWDRLTRMLDHAKKLPPGEPLPQDPPVGAVHIMELLFSAQQVEVPSVGRLPPSRVAPDVEASFSVQEMRAA